MPSTKQFKTLRPREINQSIVKLDVKANQPIPTECFQHMCLKHVWYAAYGKISNTGYMEHVWYAGEPFEMCLMFPGEPFEMCFICVWYAAYGSIVCVVFCHSTAWAADCPVGVLVCSMVCKWFPTKRCRAAVTMPWDKSSYHHNVTPSVLNMIAIVEWRTVMYQRNQTNESTQPNKWTNTRLYILYNIHNQANYFMSRNVFWSRSCQQNVYYII